MSQVRIAWCDKKRKFMSAGDWHEKKKEKVLKLWILEENKKYPDCIHWLEYKNENGNIINAIDNEPIEEWVNIKINNSEQ